MWRSHRPHAPLVDFPLSLRTGLRARIMLSESSRYLAEWGHDVW